MMICAKIFFANWVILLTVAFLDMHVFLVSLSEVNETVNIFMEIWATVSLLSIPIMLLGFIFIPYNNKTG